MAVSTQSGNPTDAAKNGSVKDSQGIGKSCPMRSGGGLHIIPVRYAIDDMEMVDFEKALEAGDPRVNAQSKTFVDEKKRTMAECQVNPLPDDGRIHSLVETCKKRGM